MNFKRKREIRSAALKGLMYLSAGLTVALVAFMIIFVLVKGIPNITWKLLATSLSYLDYSI